MPTGTTPRNHQHPSDTGDALRRHLRIVGAITARVRAGHHPTERDVEQLGIIGDDIDRRAERAEGMPLLGLTALAGQWRQAVALVGAALGVDVTCILHGDATASATWTRLSARAGMAPATLAAPPAAAQRTDDDGPDAPQAPALTLSEQRVLIALGTFDAIQPARIADVAGAMPDDCPLSERTIADAIKRLITLDLAERPHGERQGTRLTIAGRRLARKIAS